MPILASAKKALRQTIKRTAQNQKRTRILKSLAKQVKGFVNKKEIEKATSLLPQLYKAFDKAARTGVIKKNTANRYKARITRLIQKATQSK